MLNKNHLHVGVCIIIIFHSHIISYFLDHCSIALAILYPLLTPLDWKGDASHSWKFLFLTSYFTLIMGLWRHGRRQKTGERDSGEKVAICLGCVWKDCFSSAILGDIPAPCRASMGSHALPLLWDELYLRQRPTVPVLCVHYKPGVCRPHIPLCAKQTSCTIPSGNKWGFVWSSRSAGSQSI